MYSIHNRMMKYKTKNYFLKSYFEENKIGLKKNIKEWCVKNTNYILTTSPTPRVCIVEGA